MVRYPQFLDNKGFSGILTNLALCPKGPSTTYTGSRSSLRPVSPRRFYCWKAFRSLRLRPLFPLYLENGSFPQILIPRGVKEQIEPTNPMASRPSLRPLGWPSRTNLPPLWSGITDFSIRRVFSEYLPSWPYAPRISLQHPLGRVPVLGLAVPGAFTPGRYAVPTA